MRTRPAIDPEDLWRAREQIVLAPHDPRWLTDAAEECRRIEQACGPLLLRVVHIGSTSVPGLIAKPVLDLMPLVRNVEDGFECVGPMRALGYWYAGDFGIAGRHLFVKGSPRTHHAHMLVEGSKEARRHMAVRDLLRSSPEMAARYAALKQSLALRFVDDREGYAMAKSVFMRELFDRADVE
ncbi:MAG: GrpB family protein [Planctomycetes bacterium]|nr:GrpB family protein [Planctomycetota bacterium]